MLISNSDKALVDIPRAKIRQQLNEVGFDDARQQETTGGLSGGWKMKLELARAMLYNADLLLLDEVRFFYVLLGRRKTKICPMYSLRTTYARQTCAHGSVTDVHHS